MLRCVWTVNVLLVLLAVGCNRTAPADPAGQSETDPPQKQQPAQPETVAENPAKKWEVRTDADGRKWFGDVPFDVFFEDPIGVANDNGTVAVAATGDEPKTPNADNPPTTPEPKTPEPASPTKTPGSDGWSQVISAEALDREVKSIRNFLQPRLQTTGRYNTNLAMIPPQAAALAALAGIAGQHEGKITWKADALYIRDLAGSMNSEPLKRGAAAQRRLLGSFEKISDTLNRSRPSDLPEPKADASIADYAEISLLMKRMDAAYNRMKTEAGSEDAFSKNLDMVRQEAAVLSALTKVVTLKGYDYEEDEDFLGFANVVIRGGRSVVDAAATGDFGEYDKALSATYQACNQCHSSYK